MSTEPVHAAYYDGRSTRRHEVLLTREGAALRLTGAGVDLRVPLAEVRLEERMANAPRIAQLPGGGMLECADVAGADALLERAGYRDSPVVRWQGSWRIALGSLLVVMAAGAAFYVWGLPWAGDRLAAVIPQSWSDAIGREALKSLAPPVFRPSTLGAEKRAGIENTLAAVLEARGEKPPRLEFRSFAGGPNAFALPGNIVILTDEMVKLAAKTRDPENALLGVLAHERGHLVHQHGLRQFVRASILGVVIGWWIGDFSSVLATAAPILLTARYTREFEREADREAAALLKAAGRPVEPLIELFNLLEGAEPAADKRQAGRKRDEPADFFSTHPGTPERIQILRGSGG